MGWQKRCKDMRNFVYGSTDKKYRQYQVDKDGIKMYRFITKDKMGNPSVDIKKCKWRVIGADVFRKAYKDLKRKIRKGIRDDEQIHEMGR